MRNHRPLSWTCSRTRCCWCLSASLWLLSGAGHAHAEVALQQDNVCTWFHDVLNPVPHEILTLEIGAHESLWDGMTYTGCQVHFRTNDDLLSDHEVPHFSPSEDTEIYRLGWRMDSRFGADGPGTSLLALRKDSWLCLIRDDQPAYVADNGAIVQSETLQITVQCQQD